MQSQDIIKGLLAGLAGGLAATFAKTLWEENFPVRDKNTDTPPAIIAERATEKDLTEAEEKQAETGIHITFGSAVGTAYGALVEAVPEVATGMGLPFGTVFYLGTHASVVPAMGLEPYPNEVKPEYARNEFAGHLVYGVTLELVRRGVRSLL